MGIAASENVRQDKSMQSSSTAFAVDNPAMGIQETDIKDIRTAITQKREAVV
jgi:hypothetical protein